MSNSRTLITRLFSKPQFVDLLKPFFAPNYSSVWVDIFKITTAENVAIPLDLISKPKYFDNKILRVFKPQIELITPTPEIIQSLSQILTFFLQNNSSARNQWIEQNFLSIIERFSKVNIAKIEESAHPLENKSPITKDFKFEGARKLHIWFNKETTLSSNFEIRIPQYQDRPYFRASGTKARGFFPSLFVDGDSFTISIMPNLNSSWG